MNDLDLTTLEKSRDLVLQRVQTVIVYDPDSETQAAVILISVRAKLKDIKTEYEHYMKPLNETRQRIIDKFKEIKEPLEKAETELSSALTTYREDTEQKRKDWEAKLQAKEDKKFAKAIEKGKTPAIPEPLQIHIESQPKTINGLTYVQTWKAEVVNLSQVPIQFLMANMPLLNEIASASKGQNPPSGVAFYQGTSTRVK